jgi:SAM-dependent methyltransferase
MHCNDSTQRFSDRVDNYIKYRPGYPPDLYVYLQTHAKLPPGAPVADIGSGTGLLSTLFLEHGHPLYAIEPNAEMRLAGEALLASDPNFTSLDGRAEAIPLPDAAVDLVVSGQAFHWFEPLAAKAEFSRILRPGGHAALIWNDWTPDLSPFLADYHSLLSTYGTDYAQVARQNESTQTRMAAFFAPGEPILATFPNQQRFDFEGLRGRLLSSSYAPLPGHPDYTSMLAALESIFERHQQQGQVAFDYVTRVYHAPMQSDP